MHHSSSPGDRPVVDIGGAMTVSEFCRWASFGRTKMYAEVKAGRITPRKIGAKTVILRSDAEAWLRALPTATAAEELDRKEKSGKSRRSTSDTANEPPANADSAADRQGADLDTEAAR
jgi:protein involved in temperature-dependent protein secretion